MLPCGPQSAHFKRLKPMRIAASLKLGKCIKGFFLQEFENIPKGK